MVPMLRRGHVLWYDAARGYGFVNDAEDSDAVFITKSALDAFGITGLQEGFEIVFDVVKGDTSERVHSIVKLRSNVPLH